MLDLLLIPAALLPSILLLIQIYRMDRAEKEPRSLLWKLVLGGAVSGLLAGALELVGLWLLNRLLPQKTFLSLLLQNFLVIALAEEFCKRLPVMTLAWKHPAFDYRFDAVVYCVFSALGFAALENLPYVWQYRLTGALNRALLSVPAHFFFAVYMGLYLGEAKLAEKQENEAVKSTKLELSLAVPVLLHGFWDFALSIDSLLMNIIYYAFVGYFFLSASIRLRDAAKNDGPL